MNINSIPHTYHWTYTKISFFDVIRPAPSVFDKIIAVFRVVSEVKI
jgi:hypothetical protein